MTQLWFCLICCIAFASLAGASSKDSKLLLFIGVAVLSLSAGLRAFDVGIDTAFYYDAFVSNFTVRPYQFTEQGFRAIVRVLMALFGRPELVFLVVSAVTNSLVILRLWDFRKTGSFPFMSFYYIAVFYIGTMNTMRQYFAAAIVFFATRYLERKKYVSFVVLLLLATTIHTTALIGVIYLFVYLWTNTAKEKRIYVQISEVVLVPASLFIVFGYESDLMDNYLSNGFNNLNITFLYRAGSYVLAVLLLWIFDSKKDGHCGEVSLHSVGNPIPFFVLIGLSVSSVGMFFQHMGRIGYYFNLFEAVFWGLLINKKAWGWLYLLMPTIYALYVFSNELAFNGSGIFPFHLFFNF